MADIWCDVDVALSEVPINLLPLVDDTDGKTIETCTYNQAGLALYWNFMTPAGAFSHTAVTPTDTGGNYDWVSQGQGMFTIEIPASAGASINNDTEGFGWFTGVATGILPWRGPVIGFRAAGLNDKMIESAYDATRGLSGTALPAAVADAAGGLPISDAGGLDLDAQIKTDIDAILVDTDVIGSTGQGLTSLATQASVNTIDDFLDTEVAAILAAVDTEVAAILEDTAVIGALGAGLTAIPWNAAWDTEVESEVNDALVALNLDHLAGTATGIPAIPAGTYIDQIMDDGTATFDRTTDSLQAIRDTAPLGTAMRGTDSAALASVCTEGRLAELDAANLPADVAAVKADTAAILIDTGTTLDGRIPAALTGAGNMKSDSLAISGSTDAADKLEASAETIVPGTAQTGTLSTTQMTTNLTVSVADQYNGRIIIFKEDTTTAALRGQATDITDTEVLDGRLTFTAITTAPANGDTFVIV